MAIDNRDFQNRLKRALGKMTKDSVKGMTLASAYVKLEAQKRVPVDDGNLKGSAYNSVTLQGRKIVGQIGFTANYAAAVHEKPMVHQGEKRRGKGAKGRYWDPQGKGTNKFLEKAIDENHSEILQIIHKCAKL